MQKSVHKLHGMLRKNGFDKSAFRIVSAVMVSLKRESKVRDPHGAFFSALENIDQSVHLMKFRKRTGPPIIMPIPLSRERSRDIAISSLVTAAQNASSSERLSERLLKEINDASMLRGTAHMQREESLRLAVANRSNSKRSSK